MTNRRKLDVAQLQLGMYVAELDRPWLESPFLFQGFLLSDDEDLTKLKELCAFVYVDEELSAVPVPADAAASRPGDQGRTGTGTTGAQPKPHQKPVEEELPEANQIRTRVETEVDKLFTSTRLGQALNVPQAKALVADMMSSIIRNPDALVLLSTLKGHSEATAEHAFATSVIALSFGRHLGLDEDTLAELGLAALLHDIGETKVPVKILELGDREKNASYRKHPELGAELLRATKGIPRSVADVALSHQEHIDGTGYPQRLTGDQLTRLTKMVSIADVYDDLTSGRLGKLLPSTDALRSMYKFRDKYFDGELLEDFIACIGIYPVGCIVELQRGDVGIVISIPPDDRLHPRLLIVRDQQKRPLEPPRIMNLASFAKTSLADKYLIAKVVSPGTYDINLAGYILRELRK